MTSLAALAGGGGAQADKLLNGLLDAYGSNNSRTIAIRARAGAACDLQTGTSNPGPIEIGLRRDSRMTFLRSKILAQRRGSREPRRSFIDFPVKIPLDSVTVRFVIAAMATGTTARKVRLFSAKVAHAPIIYFAWDLEASGNIS
jgi:hypothetical protein